MKGQWGRKQRLNWFVPSLPPPTAVPTQIAYEAPLEHARTVGRTVGDRCFNVLWYFIKRCVSAGRFTIPLPYLPVLIVTCAVGLSCVSCHVRPVLWACHVWPVMCDLRCVTCAVWPVMCDLRCVACHEVCTASYCISVCL